LGGHRGAHLDQAQTDTGVIDLNPSAGVRQRGDSVRYSRWLFFAVGISGPIRGGCLTRAISRGGISSAFAVRGASEISELAETSTKWPRHREYMSG